MLETDATSASNPTASSNVILSLLLFSIIFERFRLRFPDMEVRKLAVKWIRGISNDELVDYLPQMVVALRHETYEDSPLARFLLDRSLRSPRVAHHLFWLLSHNLPGTIPQVCLAVLYRLKKFPTIVLELEC